MRFRTLLLSLGLLVCSAHASAQDHISTHVLDLARGVGGGGISVTLDVKTGDTWTPVGHAVSQDNGRVEAFEPVASAPAAPGAGTYRLTFDMADYWTSVGADRIGGDGVATGPPLPFFPEITVVFRLDDPSAHTHVPIVVSPYGYSTYRGN